MLSEVIIENLNRELTRKFDVEVELEEEKYTGRSPENYVCLKSKPINSNLGIFRSCFYDVKIEVGLRKAEEEGVWFGDARLYFEYHHGGSNGADAGLRVLVQGEEVSLFDIVKFEAEKKALILKYYTKVISGQMQALGFRKAEEGKPAEPFKRLTFNLFLTKHRRQKRKATDE